MSNYQSFPKSYNSNYPDPFFDYKDFLSYLWKKRPDRADISYEELITSVKQFCLDTQNDQTFANNFKKWYELQTNQSEFQKQYKNSSF